MNAQRLYLKDGKPAHVWFCDKCSVVYSSEAQSEQCCQERKCSCGKPTGSRYQYKCNACIESEREKAEREKFEKADRIPFDKWDSFIFDGNEYHESIEDMYYNSEGDYPDYVWATKKNHFVKSNLDDIVERICDDAYEDFEPDVLDGLDDLEIAINKFCELNKEICSYSPDYTKVILLPERKEVEL